MTIRHWLDIPQQPLLASDECQLWMAWLDEEDPDYFRGFLSADECLRAGRLRSRRNGDRFTIARGILRILLGRYLACQPERLVFSYGPHGKPELASGLMTGVSFNVSHSGGFSVFAIAYGREVGVDIEEIHPVGDLEAAASIFLSPVELGELKGMPAEEKLEHFFTKWTCKEAVLKAFGEGFSGPVKDILATFYQPEPKGLGKKINFQTMRLSLLDPCEGFKGALACL